MAIMVSVTSTHFHAQMTVRKSDEFFEKVQNLMFPDLNRSWLSYCYVCWKCSFTNHDWDNSADKGILGQFSGQRFMTGTIQRTRAHDWDNPADKDYWDNSVDKSTRLEQPSEERLIGIIQRTKVYDWENPADKGSSLGQPRGQRLITGTTQQTNYKNKNRTHRERLVGNSDFF